MAHEIAAYRSGVQDALTVLAQRGRRKGGAVDVANTIAEIREVLLGQEPIPHPDTEDLTAWG